MWIGRFNCFEPMSSAYSRTRGPRSIVSVATIAAARIAAASISVKLPNRSALCPRRRENRLTFSYVRGAAPEDSLRPPGCCTGCSRGLQALPDNDQQDAGVNRGPLSCVNFGHRTVSKGAELVLHLHRFDDHERLTGADGFSRFDEHADNLACHGRDNPLGPRSGLCPLASHSTAPTPVQRHEHPCGPSLERNCR